MVSAGIHGGGKTDLVFIHGNMTAQRYCYEIRKEGRKEIFYLMTHSTHFILRLYGVGHMVKDHSDSKRKPTAATWATASD